MLSGFEQGLMVLLLVVLMTGMGASLRLADFEAVLHNPRGALIGLLSQYGWMPLIAFTLATLLQLPSDQAIGLIIVGCTPGGTTSNLFTYYARADVALSISMTALSTIVAVIVMPLLLLVYASSYGALQIPYGNITGTLAVMLVPLGLGMVVRAFAPRAAALIEKIGGIAGLGVLLLLLGSGSIRNSELLARTTPTMFGAAIGLGVLGFGLGYLGAALLGIPQAARRAIAFETGIQNSPLALGIIMASFPAAQQAGLLWLPLLYAFFVLVSASLLTLWWRRA